MTSAMLLLALAMTGADGKIGYNRDIRPILADNCFACHGPDKNHRKAKLRLDEREAAIQKEAIVPGQPDKSELVARIFSKEKNEVMPPLESHKTLKPAQKELLKRWIAEGAEYEPHWAYVTPTRPTAPKVRHADRVKMPIDAFVLAALEARKIEPSPEADRRTLLRRLTLDLIGLPPTPEEVEAFVADTDPRAYQKVVDRLLTSRHYGERMAVPWLDVVRFADTVGFHGDQIQRIFPYRDYVIDAFNNNKPFDQFTIEQLAGDLLPNPTTEQLIATGFNRLNMMTREGGAQPREYIARYQGDRVRTVGMAWMGATMGCAECHDHKFDPITSKDFYRLSAFFADIKQWGVYSDYKYTPNPDLKGWTNDYPFPPEIQVESPALMRRREELRFAMDAISGIHELTADTGGFAEWRQKIAAYLRDHPDGWMTLHASGDAEATPDGAALVAAKAKGNPAFITKLPAGWLASLRVDLLPHARFGGRIIRGGKEATPLVLTAELRHAGGKATTLTFRYAEADRKNPTYRGGEEVLGIGRGWKLQTSALNQAQHGAWVLTKPLPVADGDQLTVRLTGPDLGCVRVTCSPLASDDPLAPKQALESVAGIERSGGINRNSIDPAPFWKAYLLSTAWNAKDYAAYVALHSQWQDCRGGKAWTMVTEAVKKPLTTRVLPRGNWQDQSGAIVEPGVPSFLPQPKDTGRRLTRLDLARWLVAPENPLTSRVIMNRLWKELFGAGLSTRLDDFGGMGESPTHPELLDWLAVEFRQSGWDYKHMVRTMVMSSTYRQSSSLRPELRDVDPSNRLLASQNPRRLEAEFVRDNALAIAGLLDREYGGPSDWPYQPAHYYVNLQFPDRVYIADPAPLQYRRGVYTHWQRTFLHPMLANFDAPTREDCIASRNVANTPQQALTLLNDPSFVEAARVFAGKLLDSSVKSSSDADRLDAAFLKALGRPARKQEADSLLRFLASQREHFRARAADAAKLGAVGLAPNPERIDTMELAAWTSVCRAILNLHESIIRY